MKVLPWFSSCGRMTALVLLTPLMRAQKECTHQLALPWGTRHLISPGSAGKYLKILLLLLAARQHSWALRQTLHRTSSMSQDSRSNA